MAQLPAAAQPIALDTLLSRAVAPQRPVETPLPYRSPPRPRLAPTAPREPSAPSALILITTVLTCHCGRTYRSPNAYALARYSLNEHSVRYSRADTADCAALPHIREERAVTVPYCEECF